MKTMKANISLVKENIQQREETDQYKASGKVKGQSSKNIYIHTKQMRYTKQNDENMMSNIKYWWGE